MSCRDPRLSVFAPCNTLASCSLVAATFAIRFLNHISTYLLHSFSLGSADAIRFGYSGGYRACCRMSGNFHHHSTRIHHVSRLSTKSAFPATSLTILLTVVRIDPHISFWEVRLNACSPSGIPRRSYPCRLHSCFSNLAYSWTNS